MSDYNTGVLNPLEAGAGSTEIEGSDETTLAQPEIEELELYSLASLLGEDDGETVDDTGADGLPQTEQPKQPAQTKPADYYRSQQEVDAAFSARLHRERAKWDAEQAAKYPQGKNLDQLIDADVERQARELIEKNPDMKMPLEIAKMLVKAQQPQMAQQPETQQQPQSDPSQAPVGSDEHIAWWKEKLVADEPMLQVKLNDPNATVAAYAAANPAFKAALLAGNTPLQAYEVAKAAVNAASTNAQTEMLKQLQDSNSRATTPISAKGGGQPKTMTQRIAGMTLEEMRRAVGGAELRGGSVDLRDPYEQ